MRKFTMFGGTGFIDMANAVGEMTDSFAQCCSDFWADQQTVDRLGAEHFDLAVAFYLGPCNGLIPNYFSIPFVTLTSTVRLPGLDESTFGMPIPSSYVPFDVFGTFTDKMNFQQRIQNFVEFYISEVFGIFFDQFLRRLQYEYNIKPEIKPKELHSPSLLWLSYIDVTLDYARPFTPNVIPIGGLMIAPVTPLSKDLIDFLEGSGDHGVILCSMGSAVKSVGNDLTAAMLNTFNGLHQRVIWKFGGSLPDVNMISKNIRIVDWMPQNDLLAHPQVKLLVYHGGINGVYEAINHGVPMVLIPLFADQFFVSTRVHDKGMGRMLRLPEITEENFKEAVVNVLTHVSYKKNVDHFSAIYKDLNRFQSPLERAIYWIDHVMQFGGEHLRPRSVDMGSIELYMLDVTVFLFIVSIVLCFIVFFVTRKCIRLCWRCCCDKQKTAKSREKKSVKSD